MRNEKHSKSTVIILITRNICSE